MKCEYILHRVCKGPFTNDVSREGEGGGYLNSDAVDRLRDFSTIDWSKMLKGEGGFKNPENLADVICERPLSHLRTIMP